MAKKRVATLLPQKELEIPDPNDLLSEIFGTPYFETRWGNPKEKKGRELPPRLRGQRRLISHPSQAMRKLHSLFGKHLHAKLEAMGEEAKWLRKLPSATGCTRGSNPRKNAEKHAEGEFLYITDFRGAYSSVDLERLSLLLVFIFRWDEYGADYSVSMFARNELAHFAIRVDPLYEKMRSFVSLAFAGQYGIGLAVGGPLSPWLLNLYCEVFLDSRIRSYCFRVANEGGSEKAVVFTRYVDDLVFSREVIIPSDMRREIRQMITEAGFSINHAKSFVRSIPMGTTFVTKVGIRESASQKHVLVFPKKKRRRLHGIIGSYLTPSYQNDSPEVIRGMIAEFLHYYKHTKTPTKSDEKTIALCRAFKKASDPYRKRYRGRRPH